MKSLFFAVGLFIFIAAFAVLPTENNPYVVLTISNASDNQLLVYDANGNQLQSLSTGGQGGVPPHIVGGGVARSNQLVAVINYSSQSVSLFKQEKGSFKLLKVVLTISKPVSLAFGHDHLYILGTTTVESHLLKGDAITEIPDGSTRLVVGDGSAAQVGVLSNQLIISERSNMLELADLHDGTLTGAVTSIQLPPPPKNKTPVGLATRGDNAYVTIAHSDEVGLVKKGKLEKVVSSEPQQAPCWLAISGEWLFCCNTPSKSISRYDIADNGLVLAVPVAVSTKGEPTDIAAEGKIVAVLELSSGTTNLTQFQVDDSGNLKKLNSVSTSNNANGVAIMPTNPSS